jgi:cell division septation protein DedD
MRIRMGFDDTVKVVLQEEPLAAVFKVFIEPQATRQAAQVLEKRLRADGFDSYAEPSGVDANAVALGVFSKLESAEKVAEQALGKGYEVQVAEKSRNKALYYVALGELETADFDQQVIEKVRLDLPEVKIQEKSCKALALLKSFP